MNRLDLIVLGALFLDQEFRFMDSVDQGDKRIVELAFHEEERGKDLFLSPGGSAVNTAVQASRLGRKAGIAGKLGTDPFGDIILEALQREKVYTGCLSRSERYGTGVTVILSGRRGHELDTAMITYNGANDVLEPSDLAPMEEQLKNPKERGAFFVGDFFSIPRLQPVLPDMLANAKRRGWVTVMDHGRFLRAKTPERVLRDLERALERVDLYLPSEREILELTGRSDLREALQVTQDRYGVKWIAVKRGSKGCRVRSMYEEMNVPPFPIREGGVSALGAGSAFNAGFLDQWMETPGDLLLAGRVANAAGRLKIVSGQAPNRTRLRSFLEKESTKQVER
jgi:sugar/nucleoside kinase (ribokinase family)